MLSLSSSQMPVPGSQFAEDGPLHEIVLMIDIPLTP